MRLHFDDGGRPEHHGHGHGRGHHHGHHGHHHGAHHGHHGDHHGRCRTSGWDVPEGETEAREWRLGGPEHGGPGHRGRRHGPDFDDGPRGGGRGGFGRGGRFFGSGDLRLLLLHLIGENPSHGYELIKAVEKLLGGTYSPSPGSVYPILNLLEDMGQIRSVSTEGSKKLFEITEEGREILAQDRAVIDGMLSRMSIVARSMGGMRPPEPIFQAFQTLKTAIALHPGAWTDEEVARVSGIIQAAAAAIQREGE